MTVASGFAADRDIDNVPGYSSPADLIRTTPWLMCTVKIIHVYLKCTVSAVGFFKIGCILVSTVNLGIHCSSLLNLIKPRENELNFKRWTFWFVIAANG